MRRGTVLHIFLQISLMSALIEDSWIFISASALALLQYVILVGTVGSSYLFLHLLLQYVVLVEIYEENLASCSYIFGKLSILIPS